MTFLTSLSTDHANLVVAICLKRSSDRTSSPTMPVRRSTPDRGDDFDSLDTTTNSPAGLYTMHRAVQLVHG